MSMVSWVLRSAFRYVFVMLLVRIVLYYSGVISYSFVALSAKMSIYVHINTHLYIYEKIYWIKRLKALAAFGLNEELK